MKVFRGFEPIFLRIRHKMVYNIIPVVMSWHCVGYENSESNVEKQRFKYSNTEHTGHDVTFILVLIKGAVNENL